jgi:hypothetical protein
MADTVTAAALIPFWACPATVAVVEPSNALEVLKNPTV